jgi:pimeloyl-ACP methyl ester carboxylesterase
MANDMASVMSKLGFASFSIAGHDRGGRVAYRLALDHPQRVKRLAVLDIVAIADAWERADKELATGYWPWSLLAQPEPLPERLVSAAPDAVVDNALGGWGSATHTFSPTVRAAYIEALRDPARVHAICEEYRAAATLDYEHDVADRLLSGIKRTSCVQCEMSAYDPKQTCSGSILDHRPTRIVPLLGSLSRAKSFTYVQQHFLRARMIMSHPVHVTM